MSIIRVKTTYSNVPNKRACMFISGKVCPLPLIKHKRQTLPEINVHARLFGTLEYATYSNQGFTSSVHNHRKV